MDISRNQEEKEKRNMENSGRRKEREGGREGRQERQGMKGRGAGGEMLAGFVWCKSRIVTKTRDPLVRLVPDSLKEQSIN